MMQDVFSNPDTLHVIRKSLKAKFDTDEGLLGSKELPMIVLDYDGGPSRIATSMLRAKGYTAFSCGGFPALRKFVLTRGSCRITP